MLAVGTRLGPYEIVSLIGKGGMGEVYRARDTKLERDVAIKILPGDLAKNDERVARFEREAKLLASLNHPHIAGIYGFEESQGVKAIVLEHVEGPTLAERIARGPIPVDDAIAIAKQIAMALEAGHEAGIIHRDLKPANIKVKEDGTVKVLDYGLAKALDSGPAHTSDSDASSSSPTAMRDRTQSGVILGTAAYMSPEQARGENVDARTDIWSFGAVVYEMLTGQKAFEGQTLSDTLSAVLRTEPDFSALPSGAHASHRHLLRLCLTKDARERLHHMADARLVLEGAFDAVETAATASSDWGGKRTLGVLVLIGALSSFLVWRAPPRQEPPRPVTRFTLPVPQGLYIHSRERRVMALSPDGNRLAFTGYIFGDVTSLRLYLHDLQQNASSPIPGTEAGASPFFSPDGEWVGFYADGQLKKVAIGGGAPIRLCDAEPPLAASWGADGTILFAQPGTGIMQVPADGGTPKVVLSIEVEGSVAHGPQLLPDGRHVLYTLAEGRNWNAGKIVVHSLETGERTVAVEGGRDARYLPSGHIAYVSGGALMVVGFDTRELRVTGRPATLAESVRTSQSDITGAAQFSVSNTGTMIYWAGADSELRRLVWVDRNGREEKISAQPRGFALARISPDGSRAVLVVGGSASGEQTEEDLWVWHFERETMSRLTFDPGQDLYPVWTPDGTRIAFASDRDGTINVYWKAADGTGEVERLSESELVQYPLAFTPDGRRFLYTEIRNPRDRDIGLRSLDGSGAMLIDSEFLERNAALSRDGRWLAYQSNATGQYEIYVRPFPNVEDGLWPVSNTGGTSPLWGRDGRELFYVTLEGSVMAVPVQTDRGTTFDSGNAEELFAGYYMDVPWRTYDISPDGKRFLMISTSSSGDEVRAEFDVVLNFDKELLEREAPASN